LLRSENVGPGKPTRGGHGTGEKKLYQRAFLEDTRGGGKEPKTDSKKKIGTEINSQLSAKEKRLKLIQKGLKGGRRGE